MVKNHVTTWRLTNQSRNGTSVPLELANRAVTKSTNKTKRCSSFTYFIHKTILLSLVFYGSPPPPPFLSDEQLVVMEGLMGSKTEEMRNQGLPSTLLNGYLRSSTFQVLVSVLLTLLPGLVQPCSLGQCVPCGLLGALALVLLTWPLLSSYRRCMQNPHLLPETQSRRARTWAHHSLGGTCQSWAHNSHGKRLLNERTSE